MASSPTYWGTKHKKCSAERPFFTALCLVMQALGNFFEGGYQSKCHTMHTIKCSKYKFKGLEIMFASLVQHEQRPIF